MGAILITIIVLTVGAVALWVGRRKPTPPSPNAQIPTQAHHPSAVPATPVPTQPELAPEPPQQPKPPRSQEPETSAEPAKATTPAPEPQPSVSGQESSEATPPVPLRTETAPTFQLEPPGTAAAAPQSLETTVAPPSTTYQTASADQVAPAPTVTIPAAAVIEPNVAPEPASPPLQSQGPLSNIEPAIARPADQPSPVSAIIPTTASARTLPALPRAEFLPAPSAEPTQAPPPSQSSGTLFPAVPEGQRLPASVPQPPTANETKPTAVLQSQAIHRQEQPQASSLATGDQPPPPEPKRKGPQPDENQNLLQRQGAITQEPVTREPPGDLEPPPEPAEPEEDSSPPEPKPRKKSDRIIKLGPSDDHTPKRRPSPSPAPREPRERAPKVYDPPDISEFQGPAPNGHNSPAWQEYRRWNRAISALFLLNAQPGSQALLSITPRLLAAVWQKAEGATLHPDDAVASFAQSVGKLYEAELLPHSAGLKILKSTTPDDVPLCTAFLGLAVLAAYKMESEGAYSANAYYLRLSDLLHAGTDSPDLPFNKDDYYALWAYLQHWANNKMGAIVPLPDRNEAGRFYVDLALSHVPLRKVDIERLPAFFIFADYGPGEKPPLNQLDTALQHWCSGNRRLTKAGTDALADGRRPAVLSQVAHELEVWDGAAKDEQGQTLVNIDLLLDFPNRRARLMLAAKCPDGFPKVFEADGHTLHSTGAGWYQPTPVLPSDGPLLQEGLTWECQSPSANLALRRPPARAIAFVTKDSQDHGTALMSNPGLLLGVKCAVMCVEELAALAEGFLTQASGQPCRAVKPQGFPENWVLFQGINIRNVIAPPAGLESLAADSTIRILFSGGLKVGNAYLEGSPPRISVSGTRTTTTVVSIDDNPLPLDDNGFIAGAAERLTKGIHTIKAGLRTRNVEIVEPDLAHKLAVSPNAHPPQASQKFSTTIALPPGFWCVIGAGVDQVAHVRSATTQGTFFDCPFRPLWAILCVRRAPRAICLSTQYPQAEILSPKLRVRLRANKKTRRLATRWASAIRFVNHPRLRVSDATGNEGTPALKESWQSFKHSADQVARAIRNQ